MWLTTRLWVADCPWVRDVATVNFRLGEVRTVPVASPIAGLSLLADFLWVVPLFGNVSTVMTGAGKRSNFTKAAGLSRIYQ